MTRQRSGRKPRLDPNKFGAVHNGKTFSFVRHFFNNQIEPILEKLYDEKFDKRIKHALRNYLIVSLVSTLEFFFKNEARRIVDEYNKDISPLFSGDINIPVSSLDELIREKSITKGNVIVSSFNFYDLDDINKLFSKLLHLNFFDYIQKLERSNPSRYVFRGRPIGIDYKKLLEAFVLRSQVVHEMRQVDLSNWQLLSRWDNAMNIMDAAEAIFDPTLRGTLDEIVDKQSKKDAAKKQRGNQ